MDTATGSKCPPPQKSARIPTCGKFTVGFMVPPASQMVRMFLPPAAARASATKSVLLSTGCTPLKEKATTLSSCNKEQKNTRLSVNMNTLYHGPRTAAAGDHCLHLGGIWLGHVDEPVHGD
jgi:hypothetical protein